jgi:hypothetical protein
MFWRNTREAIGRFHPVHQQLTTERTVSLSSRPGEWANVLASLSQHETAVKRRKWRLTPRVTTVMVPLIHVLSEDTAPESAIGIAADFRGPDTPGKAGAKQDVPVSGRRVRKLTQWFVLDPWLQARAELKDGSVLEIRVTDRIRHRKIHVVTANNKHKWKTKKKAVQRIDVRRTLKRGAEVHRPNAAPPRWITVRRKDGKRTVINATAKLGQVPEERDQFQAILFVVTEVFRWTMPESPRRTA